MRSQTVSASHHLSNKCSLRRTSLSSYHRVTTTQCNSDRKPAAPDPPHAVFRSQVRDKDSGCPIASRGCFRPCPTDCRRPSRAAPARRLPQRPPIYLQGWLRRARRFLRPLSPRNAHLPSREAAGRGACPAPPPSRRGTEGPIPPALARFSFSEPGRIPPAARGHGQSFRQSHAPPKPGSSPSCPQLDGQIKCKVQPNLPETVTEVKKAEQE